MTWETQEARLALLELLVRGGLKRRQAQASAYDLLAELPWTRATGRRDELSLVEERRPQLRELIERVWPAWSRALAELTARGLPPTLDGWNRLGDVRRAEEMVATPALLNRRTAAALVAPHSKAALTERRLLALGETSTTHDGILRLRPPLGLVARSRTGVADLSAIAGVLGEAAIPERAFREGLALEGPLRAVLLVENLGAWRDLPALEGWLLAHVPGWDTATVMHLFAHLAEVPAVHFGDLDPNGARIFLHLREQRADLHWFVPSFWADLIESHGRPVQWPEELDLGGLPELVRELAARSLWLEQETIVLDPRILVALEALLQQPSEVSPPTSS